jgi:hypothetical protein
MRRVLQVRLRNIGSSHPIVAWIVGCIAYGGLLGFILVLCLILIGGFCISYDYVFNKNQEPELTLFVPFVLLPFAMDAGYPWSSEFFGKTNNYSIPGILGCIVLNGLLAGMLYVAFYVFYRFITRPKRDKKRE